MKKILFTLITTSAILMIAVGCQQPQRGEPIVRVDRIILDSGSLEDFTRVYRNFPASMPQFFPAARTPLTFMLESEAIYQFAKLAPGGSFRARSAVEDSIAATLDWAWKKRYYTASLFVDLLATNLGFSDRELEAFYRQNTDLFARPGTTEDGSDTTYLAPFEEIKRIVADELFYATFPPSDEFIADVTAHLQGADYDTMMIRNHWLYNVRSNPQDFFMRKFHEEKNGAAYTGDITQIFGDEGQPLNSLDVEVITSWLPQSHRGMPLRDRVEWLYKWKLFSDRATATGLATNNAELKSTLHWGMRIEFAHAFLSANVVPNVSDELSAADTTLAELIASDRLRFVVGADARDLDNVVRTRVAVAVDSAIHNMRKAVGVTFLAADSNDNRGVDPAKFLELADSLRDAAAESFTQTHADSLVAESERLYGILADNFAFTSEGRSAMGELAKSLLERMEPTSFGGSRNFFEAITLYRRAQTVETDVENLCGSHFLTGFAYDEYMKNFALAEASYRWILRHAPECGLASDAEFMIQNLGEPMASIEEIRGQSIRQGRKIDFEDEVSE